MQNWNGSEWINIIIEIILELLFLALPYSIIYSLLYSVRKTDVILLGHLLERENYDTTWEKWTKRDRFKSWFWRRYDKKNIQIYEECRRKKLSKRS